ncbi:MAG: SAM-dependent chlorinase/fluorinase [Bacteroidetes bacterium]|nr:SAM-dependent chlorinase/fluorinase [Bacteroidota bacterium]
MPIITLTSDWGLKDHYLAVVKAVIHSQLKDVTIVDISHLIPQYDIGQAAYVVKNACSYFPEGTIHIIGVNSVASIETPHIGIFNKGHYFIGADNGLFSLIFDKNPEKIVELEITQDSDYFTFSTKDVFVKAACFIAKGGKLEDLGHIKDHLHVKKTLLPIINENSISGNIIYVDVYENVITNIAEADFKKVQKGRNFSIEIRRNTVTKLSKSYHDVPEGDLLALFGSNGMLQIALNTDKAKSLLGLNYDDRIMITFS